MLWLAVVLSALPLEVFASRPTPFGVIEDNVLVACDLAAKRQGLSPGLSVTQSYSLCPSLSLKVRERVAEEALLESLAVFAYSLSPRVVLRSNGLLLRFTDKVSPIGDPHLVVSRMREWLGGLGYECEVAMAPTAMAAWLCADSGLSVLWTHQEAWRESVRALSITRLPLAKKVRDACQSLGLECVGDVLDLPRAALARRLGEGVAETLEKLMGERPEVEVFWEPPLRFRRRLIFSSPVDSEEALLFAFQRILREWSAVLRGRASRVSQFAIDIEHQDHTFRSELFALTRPERSADILMMLVRERLRSFKPSSAIIAVSLRSALEASEEPNLTLWRDGEWGDQGFKELLDRFHARLGRAAVCVVSVCSDHRPERATTEGPWPPLGSGDQHAPPSSDRPLWLVDPPMSLSALHDVPHLSGPLRFLKGPERLETGWWDDPVVRDYFVALNPRNECLWVFRSMDGHWFLQGYFC